MEIGIREASMSGCCIINPQTQEASQNGSRTSSNRRAAGAAEVASIEAPGNQSSEQFPCQNLYASPRGALPTGRLPACRSHAAIGAQIIRRSSNSGGVEAIEWYPYWHVDNTPHKFFADVVEQIAEVALSSAKSLIGMTQWSLSKLREYLVSQRSSRQSVRIGSIRFWCGIGFAGDAPRRGRIPTTPKFSRNTGESAVSTSIAPRERGEFCVE